MPFHRGSRGSRRGSMRAVIQSYKKVINHAPASRAADANINLALSAGVDSVAAGQTGPVDANVPTGAIIKYFLIKFGVTNLVSATVFTWVAIQRLHSGQSIIGPDTVGGNPQRNQIHHQDFFCTGKDQNQNRTIKFKVPAKFQRVREGDKWNLTIKSDLVTGMGAQIIYKFYR